MAQIDPLLFTIGVALLMIAAFWIGYTAAETREREARDLIEKNLRDLRNQKAKLTQWVRSNWPNEFEAYRRGHQEGYQQGVLQSPDLTAYAEAEE